MPRTSAIATSPRRWSGPTAPSRRLRRTAALLAVALPAVGACRFPAAPGAQVVLAAWHLDGYAYTDRTGDGRAIDAKPETEREAVAAVLARLRPDAVLVQDIGGPAMLEDLEARLAARGLVYPYREHLWRDDGARGQALLSRLPIARRDSDRESVYTIGGQPEPVRRGFLDVTLEAAPGRTVRILGAQLKSRAFDPRGQTEMRRSEARLLARRVRAALAEAPDGALLVMGCLNDLPGAAPLRDLLGAGAAALADLEPRDDAGDAWTRADPAEGVWQRLDYLLANEPLRAALVPGSAHILRDPAAAGASAHRPLLLALRPGALNDAWAGEPGAALRAGAGP